MDEKIKCDICSKPFLTLVKVNEFDAVLTFPVVDENYNTQKGLVQCEDCFRETLNVDEKD